MHAVLPEIASRWRYIVTFGNEVPSVKDVLDHVKCLLKEAVHKTFAALTLLRLDRFAA